MVDAMKKLVFISNLLFLGVIQCQNSKVVETEVGSFRGAASSDGSYFQFLGVPYGEVDAANPFGEASPHPSVSGTYEANKSSFRCPQSSNGIISGSLDCLRLNVFVPSTATATSNLPVMIYLHGGFFHNGHVEELGPKFLVRHDVIVVNIHYRVGPYGFMCLDRRAAPGNQGLKDQTLAMKWVKRNIKAFGGNPDNLTLFGQSAGAHAVDFHILSEQEKLFTRAILQSGSSLAQSVNYEPDREAPIKLAAHLDLDHSSVSAALKSLTNAPTDDVIRAAVQLDMQFKPCAETKFEGVEPFLTKFWLDSPTPKAQNMAIMIGFTEYERLLSHIGMGTQHFASIANLVQDSLNHTFSFDDEKMYKMEGHMRRFYFGDDPVSQDTMWQLVDFESDHLYNHPMQRSAKKFVEAGASNVFYYMFAYSGARSHVSTGNHNVRAAVHSDDLRYLFDISTLPSQITAEDQATIDRMTTMWTNFAKYGDPTPATTTLLPVKWVPLTSDVYHYLRIDSQMTMERRPFNRRMAFLDLFLKLNGKDERRYEAALPAEDDDDDNAGVAITASLLNITIMLILVTLNRV